MSRLRRAIEGFEAFVDRPLYLWTRPVLLLLLVPLALAFFRPLWAVELESPHHPDGLWLDVYVTRIASGHDGADLVKINALHQTIGMQTLDARTLGDLDWLPFGFGVLGLLTLRVAVLGNVRALIDAAVLGGYFVLFTLARFAHKLHVLGHQLSPDAPSPVAPFSPVVMGTQKIGDISVHAGPGAGTWLAGAFFAGLAAITVWHLVRGKREAARMDEAGG